ncbi:MAG: hypothetical protein R3247_04290 [Rhodothermales bacterium]|nr:hypothetical protein [Rhodothermales bacterium]
MPDELWLRRKLTLRAHGRQVVFVKKRQESLEHVLMKAFLWALYLPDYPDLTVEVGIGDKYKPDVVALDAHGRPVFWGEAGKVSAAKIASLVRRYRGTHFALAKWSMDLAPLRALVQGTLDGYARTAPFDLLSFPRDSAARFVDARGHIAISPEEVERVRLG